MAKSLYVGGLPYTTTRETLRTLFTEVGDVSSVRVIMDRETGQSKGLAFVEMANDAEPLVAVNHYTGYPLDGRTLVVNEARPREERGGGGYAANRGGYRSY